MREWSCLLHGWHYSINTVNCRMGETPSAKLQAGIFQMPAFLYEYQGNE